MTTELHGTMAIPEATHRFPETTPDDLDRAIRDVAGQASTWAELPIPDRIRLLDRIVDDTLAEAEDWVLDALEAKGITPGTPPEGEEWLTGPGLVIRCARLLRATLSDIHAFGRPRYPGPVGARPDGRATVGVYPTDRWDSLLFPGVRGEIWMRPGIGPADVDPHAGAPYRPDRPRRPKVVAVLGAGNVSSIPATDVLSKMFGEHGVVVLKMSPVNEYIGPHLARALSALVERGFLRIVYGGASVGERLVRHPLVDAVHLTGSDKTFDAIVWGTGEEAERRKAQGTPKLEKEITAELGNVSPWIVVPGDWSDRDIRFQAEHLATSLVNNAGFNCNATRVIVQHAGWSQRGALMDALRRVLAEIPPRRPYYPGAADRWRRYVEAHPEAERFGVEKGAEVPWTLIPGVDPRQEGDLCFATEAFTGVFCETELDAADPVRFLDAAVDFCNDKVWGSLNATIVVHPSSLKDPAMAAALDRAKERLRYGSIGVNMWAAASYALMSTPWGAYPGATLEDIGSGIGFVHNTYLFDGIEKAVVTGPFRTPTRPPWFATHRRAHEVFRRYPAFEAHPSIRRLLSLLPYAVRA